MLDYENMYKILFYGITSAIRDIEKQNFGMAHDILIKVQQEAEEVYIQSEK